MIMKLDRVNEVWVAVFSVPFVVGLGNDVSP